MSTQQQEQHKTTPLLSSFQLKKLKKKVIVTFIPVRHLCHREDVNAWSKTATRIH